MLFFGLLPACLAMGSPPVDADSMEVAGATIAEWRERIGRMDLRDPDSRRLVPGLIELAETSTVPWVTRRQATLTLGRLGALAPEGIPVMLRLLENPGEEATTPQLWALKAIALYGPVASQTGPAVAEIALRPETSPLTRLTAIDALSQIGPASPAAIPTLIALASGHLPHPTDDTQIAAVEALGYVGPAAGPAVPQLIRCLDADEPTLRREAATALGRIGFAAEQASPALVERLVDDTDVTVRDAAMNALGNTGSSSGPLLAEFAASESAELRERVLVIFGHWGPAARPWLTSVKATVSDAEPSVRLAGLRAWTRILPNDPEVAVRVARELEHADRQVRRRALTLFLSLGPERVAARDLLNRLRKSPSASVRTAASKAWDSLPPIAEQ